jgi:quercetin dioxygenase-like cupin family protein
LVVHLYVRKILDNDLFFCQVSRNVSFGGSMRRFFLLVLVLLVVATAAWLGYRYANRRAFLASGPLPPPPSGQVTFAGSTPEHSFHLEEGNVLARTVFEAVTPSNSHVQVRDVMLPPNAKSKLAALPGPALVEVYSGEGTMALGEKAEKSDRLTAGNMRSVPAGQVLAFDNQGALPLVLRLYVFEAK